MTKQAAIQAFFESFSLTAYEENAVPVDAQLPYITYQSAVDDFGDIVSITASVWYRGTSWTACNAKAREIGDYITRGGVFLPCDGGAIWVKKGVPFSQTMSDDNDKMIKRNYLNLELEFLTEN